MPAKNPPLTPHQQRYIETHYNELSFNEIARNIHISVERVRNHLIAKGISYRDPIKGTKHRRKPDKVQPGCFNYSQYTNWLVG